MTQCQLSNSGHAQRIQVQYNEQQVRITIQNGPDLKKIINCCVHEQHKQHHNTYDAKLPTAIMAKNTTVAKTSSQNNEEHNISVAISKEPLLLIETNQLSAHNSHNQNDWQNNLAHATPPPSSEILAKVLEEARDFLDAIGTLNKQTFYADSQLHRPPTPATCSDVRDSSSQAVPIREDGIVSVKVVTVHSLPEKRQEEEYNLELLPKFYALERNDKDADADDDELIWPEVNQFIEIDSENHQAIVEFSNDKQQVVNEDKEHDKREPERDTEVLDDVAAMTLTQIDETSEQFVSESSLNEDNCEEQIDEMKYEMKGVKNNLPDTQAIRRHSLTHTYKNEPNIGNLGAVGQRPTSALIGAGTRTPLVDAKYARSHDKPDAVRTSSTLHGSSATTMPIKYAKTHEDYTGASRPSNTLHGNAAPENYANLIDTKIGRSKDEPSAKRFTNSYVGPQRTGNLDTKYAKASDEQSALRSATSLHGNARKLSLTDTKYDRTKEEPSATKFSNSLYGGIYNASKNYEPNAAKLSNLSLHGVTRAGYAAAPLVVDSKYAKIDEPSATNRSNSLLAGSRTTNSTSQLDTRYGGKHNEPSAQSSLHGTTRSANSSSFHDSKNYRTNDEPPSSIKLSTVLRADTRPSSFFLPDSSKYAKTSDELGSALRLPHSVATRLTDDATPLVDTKYARTHVEPTATSDKLSRSAASVDGLSVVIPRSTRLRRQRRMHSQSSQEQAEDTIERLNRLRARISGALSEVKGVLKHYSTDTEPEVETQKEKESQDVVVQKSDIGEKVEISQETQEKSVENEGPVSFRFVKKVRRRSVFDENDEDNEKRAEELAQTMATEEEKEEKKTEGKEASSALENQKETESVPGVNLGNVTALKSKSEKDSVSNKNLESIKPELIVAETPDRTIIRPQQEESNEIPALDNVQKKQSIEKFKDHKDNVEEIVLEPSTTDADTSAPKKSKKKIIVKTGVNRRASIAAVEVSKIEPPITPTLSLNIKTQRRPSDSEAIVKKKVTPRTTATDETASKVKIIHKVKRPSVKKTNEIATDQNKTITSKAVAAPATNSENNNNSSDINDRANFSSKDATTVATTPTTTTALATQLVIDDASLTIAAAKDDDATSLATIGLEEANAVMVAAKLLSPLRTNETNSQAKAVAATEQLVNLVGETLTVGSAVTKTPTIFEKIISEKTPQINDSSYVPLKLIDAKLDELLRSDVKEKVAEKANVQEHKGEKLIDQKVIPAHSTAIKHARQSQSDVQSEQQQVCNDTAVPQEAFTFTFNRPQDVTTNDIAKETTSPTPTPTPTSVEPINVDATKAANTETTINSAEATSPTDTPPSVTSTAAAMPELQVKVLQAFLKPIVPAPFNVTKDECVKKKVVLKKLLRKNSTEKAQKANLLQTVTEEQKNTINAATKDKSKKLSPSEGDNSKAKPTIPETANVTDEKSSSATMLENDDADWPGDFNEEIEEEVIEEEPAPEKKKRRIKKKVIIKRQPRKLSISDTFFKGPEAEPSTPIEETLEKPVEYVKINSDEEQDYEEILKPAAPTKSCIKLREFQVGDRVMYAERYKKTLVRWKRGIVLERITSISYKLEVEGKEVPAHISYIKKFTDRKVNFSGKEYLEIDYEQIAEEEEKARRYSIWNMV